MEEKIFPYLNKMPKIASDVFLAPGVKIIGDVKIGEGSSIWYNSIIRGDINYIRIGSLTNIQDNCVLHVTGKNPLIVGNKVTVGHSAILHGATIMDLTLIGIGGIVLEGSVIEEKSIVAAGAVVKPDFIVPSGKLAAGVPAKVVRNLTNDELNEFEDLANRYKEYANLSYNSIGVRNQR
jgi:carbonic anhydrase/acetyltransferase-like protein (isoleucine patch superfamily)